MTRPRVHVTGIGLLTGLGATRELSWEGLRAGRCAATRLDDRGLGLLGCPAPVPRDSEGEPVLNLLDRVAEEAIEDANLFPDGVDRERTAVLIGSSKGGVRSLSRLHDEVTSGRGDADAIARAWVESWPSAGASRLARRYGLRGPCLAPVAACATGLVAALQGADLIRRGVCDVAIAGSVDAALEPILLGAFRSLKVLSRDDRAPAEAIRPWDRSRSGFLVGEGGAVLVLERAEHAEARGAWPYAELAGGALGSDAFHETALDPDPAGLARLIAQALGNAGVGPSELDYVNVHGTATRANDPLECAALRLALGGDAYRVACSATKSQIGHLLGAAGSAELAITCLAIRDSFVPPTLNLHDPDPACDLDGTPLVGKVRPIAAALKLSIGFGGHLAAAVLRRPSEARG